MFMSDNNEINTAEGGIGGNIFGRDLWEVAKVILISMAIVLPIRYFIVQPFIVRGASMEPNFETSDYLIIDEVSYFLGKPGRGEVIVFRYPRDPRQFFIKRIISLPGERIEIKDGSIRIYNVEHPRGFALSEPYLSPVEPPTGPNINVTLGASEYFVLGDNRDESSDSRVWGPLDKKFIIGRAFLRAWPVNKFGLVPETAFSK